MALIILDLISDFNKLQVAHMAPFEIKMFLHPGSIQWTVYISFNSKCCFFLLFPLAQCNQSWMKRLLCSLSSTVPVPEELGLFCQIVCFILHAG